MRNSLIKKAGIGLLIAGGIYLGTFGYLKLSFEETKRYNKDVAMKRVVFPLDMVKYERTSKGEQMVIHQPYKKCSWIHIIEERDKDGTKFELAYSYDPYNEKYYEISTEEASKILTDYKKRIKTDETIEKVLQEYK